jgi:HEAT repeat protein
MTPSRPARDLSSRDRSRVEEVQRLALGGPASVAELVALLSEPSWVVRRFVVGALARIGTPAVGALCDVLQGDRTHETLLAAAVEALVDSVGDVESALLALAERTETAAVLCDIAQVLGRRRNRAIVPLLARWAAHPDDNVAVAALEALGRIGGVAAIEPLLGAVRSRSLFRTFPAIALLGQSGDPRVVAPLVELLDEPHYMTEAIGALGASGQIRAIAPLARLLVGPDPWRVRSAARALTKLRTRILDRFGDPVAMEAAFQEAVAGKDAVDSLRRALVGADVGDAVALATVLAWLQDPTGVEQLLALLDGDPATVQAVCEALRGLGPVAAPAVGAALRTGSSARRACLLPLVVPRRSAVADLLFCLDDPQASIRVLACSALGRIGDPSVVGSLFGLIGDANVRVSQAAIAAVQSLGSEETKVHALAAAQSAHPATRRASLRILSYFGYAEGLDALLAAIEDDDERVRDAAAPGLALLEDPRALAALMASSRHPSPSTRAATMRAFGHSTSTPEIVAVLERGLEDAEPWVRYYACQSLGRLLATSAADKIIPLLDDAEGQVRVAAVEAMARLGGDRALATLDRASVATDVDVRRAALVGLGLIRRPDAVALIVRATESPDPATRVAAVSALEGTTTPVAESALIRAASDPDDRVRAPAFELLAVLPGPQVTRWLVDRLAVDGDRERALSALAHEVDGRIEGILSALETADSMTSPLLVEALLRMRRPNGNAAAEAVLQLENVHARRAAAALLVGIASPGLRETLSQAALLDPDAEVRQICAAAV